MARFASILLLLLAPRLASAQEVVPPPPALPGPPPPSWDDDDLPPVRADRPRVTPGADLEPGFFGGLLGELVATSIGAGMGMAIASTSQCPPRADCAETLGLAALIGGAGLMPFGAVLGVWVGADLAQQRGDLGWTILATLAGYALGGLIVGLTFLVDEPGGAAAGAVMGAGIAPLLGAAAFDGHW